MQLPVTASELWLLLPFVLVVLTSIVPITVKVCNGNKEQPQFATLLQAVVGLVVAASFIIRQWDNLKGFEFQGALVFDGLSSWTNLISIGVAIFVLLISYSNHATRLNQFSEHVFLVLSALAGMMVLIWSNDLIVTFIGMELMSLAIYVLVGLSAEQKFSKEAAFKYFILGSFASAVFLYGVALMYGAAESTSFTRLFEVGPALLNSSPIFLMGVILVVSGLLFKVSIFPFHGWTPDVYQGAPTSITAFMSTGVKLTMFSVFLRLVTTRGILNHQNLLLILQWLAVFTMFLGNLAALRQQNIKRMLAYSSIAHSGYILVGIIALGASSAGLSAASGVVFYLLTYSVMNIGAFALISMFEKNEDHSVVVDDLKGLASRKPMLALAFAVCMLSLAGFPPTAGFFGKFYIFSSAVREGMVWMTVWGIISSAMGVYYYLRPVVNMYMYPSNGVETQPQRAAVLALAVSAVLIIVMGFASNPVFGVVSKSMETLFN